MYRLCIILLFSLIACSEVETEKHKVKEVVDGDTIRIEDGSSKGKLVRLIGINAPESRNFKHRTEEAFGKEASAYLQSILQNKSVELEYDVERNDKYDRLLAYVWLGDTLINELMIEQGWAQTMTIQPNTKYADQFARAQKDARNKGLGIWKDL